MLKETETEEKIGFFVTFLSLVTFQLREDRAHCTPWLRLWSNIHCLNSKNQNDLGIDQNIESILNFFRYNADNCLVAS